MEVRQPLSVQKLASRKIVERVPKQIRSLHPIESLKPRSGDRHHHLRALTAKSAKGRKATARRCHRVTTASLPKAEIHREVWHVRWCRERTLTEPRIE